MKVEITKTPCGLGPLMTDFSESRHSQTRGMLLVNSCLKVYFVQYKYNYPRFLFISVYMEYLFPVFHLQSVCVFTSEVSLLQAEYIWISYFIHSFTLCLLIEAFSPFTFKIIIDSYVLIGILLIVIRLFLQFSSVPFFFSCSLPLCFDDFLQCCIWIPFSLFFIYLLQVFGLWLS